MNKVHGSVWSEVAQMAYGRDRRKINDRMAIYTAWKRNTVRRKVLAATKEAKKCTTPNVVSSDVIQASVTPSSGITPSIISLNVSQATVAPSSCASPSIVPLNFIPASVETSSGIATNIIPLDVIQATVTPSSCTTPSIISSNALQTTVAPSSSTSFIIIPLNLHDEESGGFFREPMDETAATNSFNVDTRLYMIDADRRHVEFSDESSNSTTSTWDGEIDNSKTNTLEPRPINEALPYSSSREQNQSAERMFRAPQLNSESPNFRTRLTVTFTSPPSDLTRTPTSTSTGTTRTCQPTSRVASISRVNITGHSTKTTSVPTDLSARLMSALHNVSKTPTSSELTRTPTSSMSTCIKPTSVTTICDRVNISTSYTTSLPAISSTVAYARQDVIVTRTSSISPLASHHSPISTCAQTNVETTPTFPPPELNLRRSFFQMHARSRSISPHADQSVVEPTSAALNVSSIRRSRVMGERRRLESNCNDSQRDMTNERVGAQHHSSVVTEAVAQSAETQHGMQQQPPVTVTKFLQATAFNRLLGDRNAKCLLGDWMTVFFNLFQTEVWNRCALSFKDNRFKQTRHARSAVPYWQCRAYCRHSQRCIKVKMSIVNEPSEHVRTIPVVITVSGTCTHIDGEENDNVSLLPNRRQLSGDCRTETVATLRQQGQSATEHYYRSLGRVNEDACLSGHTSECQTPTVLRQAVYQDRRREQLHDNMVLELEIQKSSLLAAMPGDKLSGYIHSIGLDPFHVVFFCEKQLQIYIQSCKWAGGCTLHIDATGSVTRDLPGQKRPLYYCLLLADNSLPVCDILSTRHTSESIQARLLLFNYYVSVVNGNKLVKPRFIVTDFSYAILNACIKSFNDETLSSYLHRCYRFLLFKSSQEVILKTTFLILCFAHMIKTVLRRLTRVETSLQKRKLILLLFTKLAKSDSLQSAASLYKVMHIALCLHRNDNTVRDAKQGLTELLLQEEDASLLQGYDDEQQHDIDDRAAEGDCTPDDLQTLKEQSPFTEFFRTCITTLNNEDGEQSSAENDWYSPMGFAVLTEYMHLYPLWSAALQHDPERLATEFTGDRKSQQIITRSNAAIESHFRGTKVGRLGGRRSVRPKQFIDLELAYVNGKLNEAKLPGTSRRRSATSTQLADMEERWGPRRRRLGSHAVNRVATYSSPSTASRVLGSLSRRSSRGRGRSSSRGVGRVRGVHDNQASSATVIPTSADLIATSCTVAAPSLVQRPMLTIPRQVTGARVTMLSSVRHMATTSSSTAMKPLLLRKVISSSSSIVPTSKRPIHVRMFVSSAGPTMNILSSVRPRLTMSTPMQSSNNIGSSSTIAPTQSQPTRVQMFLSTAGATMMTKLSSMRPRLTTSTSSALRHKPLSVNRFFSSKIVPTTSQPARVRMFMSSADISTRLTPSAASRMSTSTLFCLPGSALTVSSTRPPPSTDKMMKSLANCQLAPSRGRSMPKSTSSIQLQNSSARPNVFISSAASASSVPYGGNTTTKSTITPVSDSAVSRNTTSTVCSTRLTYSLFTPITSSSLTAIRLRPPSFATMTSSLGSAETIITNSAIRQLSAIPVPSCTDLVGLSLHDDDILCAINIINEMFPGAKLQATSLGIYRPTESMPNFKAAPGIFTQIFYLPGHWVVCTNKFSPSSHDIYWYDSLPKNFVRKEAVVQLSSLLRYDAEEQLMRIHLRNTNRQPDNSDACGFYAIAFTLAICAGVDPTLMRFDFKLLVQYIRNGLQNGRFNDTLPGLITCDVNDLSVVLELKLHCICQRVYTYGSMVTCNICGNHYHAKCMSLHYEVCPPLLWRGPCCPDPLSRSPRIVPDAQDEEVVSTLDELYRTSSPIVVSRRRRRPAVPERFSPIMDNALDCCVPL